MLRGEKSPAAASRQPPPCPQPACGRRQRCVSSVSTTKPIDTNGIRCKHVWRQQLSRLCLIGGSDVRTKHAPRPMPVAWAPGRAMPALHSGRGKPTTCARRRAKRRFGAARRRNRGARRTADVEGEKDACPVFDPEALFEPEPQSRGQTRRERSRTDDKRGLKCRYCGCRQFRVVYTRRAWSSCCVAILRRAVRQAHPPTGACPPKRWRRWVSALREAHDNVGAPDRALTGSYADCITPRPAEQALGRHLRHWALRRLREFPRVGSYAADRPDEGTYAVCILTGGFNETHRSHNVGFCRLWLR